MLRALSFACLLLTGGCAAHYQARVAHHEARALALEAEGDMAGALREREAAEHARTISAGEPKTSATTRRR